MVVTGLYYTLKDKDKITADSFYTNMMRVKIKQQKIKPKMKLGIIRSKHKI